MSRARVIPAVDLLLGHPEVQALTARHGAGPVRDALDAAIQGLRTALLAGDARDVVDRSGAEAALLVRIATAFATRRQAALQPVINATGVIIHTNLGRAPLGRVALTAIGEVAAGYCSLEFDLASGQRGSRHALLDRSLRDATGADSGLVANNTAAAMTVALAALAGGREVIISRGELVEIGGGFRVPEILRMSGAVLREVGTTNRTRAADYAAAVSPRTGAFLRVHPSNFRMTGFTERPELSELAGIARRLQVPLLEDQGSGWLGLDLFEADAFPADTRALLADEPSVRASVRHGADVIGFSGDKLLGGPQCGILVGRQDLLHRIRAHPLMRAVRADKLTYAALDATLQAFSQGRAITDVPVVRMLAEPAEAIATRATSLHDVLRDDHADVRLEPGWSTIGGGSAPGSAVSTTLVSVGADAADRLLARLRGGTPPVVARIVDGRVCLDLRTVEPASDGMLADALTVALALR